MRQRKFKIGYSIHLNSLNFETAQGKKLFDVLFDTSIRVNLKTVKTFEEGVPIISVIIPKLSYCIEDMSETYSAFTGSMLSR